MKKMLILLAVVAGVTGCTNTEKGAVVGGAGGAAIGAAVSGDAGGAIIGGIAGATAGALIGNATEPGYCVYRERRYPHRRYQAPC
jgi:Glycine zipper 2TM domain